MPSRSAIRESGARLLQAHAGRSSAAACQRPRCARPWHARHSGPYASSCAARWPLFRLAGNRARRSVRSATPPRTRPRSACTPSLASVRTFQLPGFWRRRSALAKRQAESCPRIRRFDILVLALPTSDVLLNSHFCEPFENPSWAFPGTLGFNGQAEAKLGARAGGDDSSATSPSAPSVCARLPARRKRGPGDQRSWAPRDPNAERATYARSAAYGVRSPKGCPRR